MWECLSVSVCWSCGRLATCLGSLWTRTESADPVSVTVKHSGNGCWGRYFFHYVKVIVYKCRYVKKKPYKKLHLCRGGAESAAGVAPHPSHVPHSGLVHWLCLHQWFAQAVDFFQDLWGTAICFYHSVKQNTFNQAISYLLHYLTVKSWASMSPHIVGVDFKTHEPHVQSYIHSNIHTCIHTLDLDYG